MAVQQGEIAFPYNVQPDWSITERLDGTIEGVLEFVTTRDWRAFLPELEDEHPGDDRLELHTREIRFLPHSRVSMTGHYLGLADDPTDSIISYVGSPDRERIETHPDFKTTIGGTAAGALNQAIFLDASGRQTSKDAAGNRFAYFDEDSDLAGVEYFLRASTQVELSWWQTDVPTVQRMVIVEDIKPFKKPDDVTDFLIVDTPYRQVGSHYQVTQIALGSSGGGWSQLLYPQ